MERLVKIMKIVKYKEISTKVIINRKSKKVIFFSGAFDLFHFGHFRALETAALLGNFLIVQIDGNELVRKRKGIKRPHLDESIRARIVASLDFIDCVFVSDIPSEDVQTLNMIKPDIFVRAILPNETDQARKQREKILLEKIPNAKIFWLKQSAEISTSIISQSLKEFNNEKSIMENILS